VERKFTVALQIEEPAALLLNHTDAGAEITETEDEKSPHVPELLIQ
jgi:hypothetical protein